MVINTLNFSTDVMLDNGVFNHHLSMVCLYKGSKMIIDSYHVKCLSYY